MWYYAQRSRVLMHDRYDMGQGYSGHGAGRDNPEFESVPNVGPIPAGQYSIGKAYTHPRKGPVAMALTPQGHNARGRTAFLIHGPNAKHPADSSEGCLILGPDLRRKIAESNDNELTVTK